MYRTGYAYGDVEAAGDALVSLCRPQPLYPCIPGRHRGCGDAQGAVRDEQIELRHALGDL
jgi:hypothetical protein